MKFSKSVQKSYPGHLTPQRFTHVSTMYQVYGYMRQCHVHSGILNTFLGTVIAARLQTVFDLFDSMNKYNTQKYLSIIADTARTTKKDLINYMKFESTWHNTNRINIMCNDILVFVQLLERRACIGDIVGSRWCANEIISMVLKTAITTPPYWLSW